MLTKTKINSNTTAKIVQPARPAVPNSPMARRSTAGRTPLPDHAPISLHRFNAPVTVSEIQALRARKRRRSFRRSRLARFRFELVALHKAGASYRDLVQWLRQHRIKVSHTTVLRYLAQLPELKEENHAKLP